MKRLLAIFLLLASCSPVSEDKVNAARTRIENELKNNGVYERGNLPEDLDMERLNGYFDIVQGAYRYVVNEDRVGRPELPIVEDGDTVEFRFDARIYSSSFDSSTTYYTNIEARRNTLAGANAEFDPEFWPTAPLRVKLSDDAGILKSVQRALVGCRAIGATPAEGTESDVVRIYLPPNVAFGQTAVYNVPSGSSLVFEITEIKIVES